MRTFLRGPSTIHKPSRGETYSAALPLRCCRISDSTGSRRFPRRPKIRRNILLATVLTCVVIGFLSAAEVYVAQLVWPATEPFPNADTAYASAAARTWAP